MTLKWSNQRYPVKGGKKKKIQKRDTIEINKQVDKCVDPTDDAQQTDIRFRLDEDVRDCLSSDVMPMLPVLLLLPQLPFAALIGTNSHTPLLKQSSMTTGVHDIFKIIHLIDGGFQQQPQ
uniref:Uncharacterized protein n=1 Tax=Anopheles coluzzii TaxID=1518534 RepID=A0A8W7Q193_ANOCL